jgi:hypothetical protein
MRTNILTFSQRRKPPQDSHQPATNRKEQEREREMCKLVIVEYELRLRSVRNGYVKKYQ